MAAAEREVFEQITGNVSASALTLRRFSPGAAAPHRAAAKVTPSCIRMVCVGALA
jgi:hypothetical protein